MFDLNRLKNAITENTGKGKPYTRRNLSMAATAGKNPDLVRNLMNGKSKNPSYPAVNGLADAMGMNVTDFSCSPPINNESVESGGEAVSQQHGKRLNSGGDVTEYLESPDSKSLALETKPVTIHLPQNMLAKLNMQAASYGVTLQALINIWLAGKLEDLAKSRV